jgi:hypothetical protein
MTSLLSRLAGNGAARPYGVQGATIKPADVSKRLADTETSLRALQLRYGPIAFAADGGDSEAVKALADLNTDIRSTEDRIRALNATLAEANRLQALAAEVARENLFNSQRKAVEAHLSIRRQAANDFGEALSAAAKAWRKLVTATDKANAAWPAGMPERPGLLTVRELANLASQEAWRVSADGASAEPGMFALPGSLHSTETANDPEAAEPFATFIANENDSAAAVLKLRADSFRGSANG